MGVGLYFHTYKWYLGLSAPRIFNTENSSNKDYVSFDQVNYYFTGGYVVDLSTQIKLKTAFMLKGTDGAPISVDATLNFLFYEKLWLGVSYRFGDGIGFIADFQVLKQLRLGYAYEAPLSDIKRGTYGTHEVLAIFELKFNNSKMKSPRYF
jgi:type IX secretion system PorP/SprF family membrane protein